MRVPAARQLRAGDAPAHQIPAVCEHEGSARSAPAAPIVAIDSAGYPFFGSSILCTRAALGAAQLSEDQKAVLIAAIERNSGTWLSGTAPYTQTCNIQHTTSNNPGEQYDRLGTHAGGRRRRHSHSNETRNEHYTQQFASFVLPHVRTYQSGCLCASE